MARTLDELREEAMKLGVEERGALADAIWESLLTDEEREIQQSWIEEAERRLQEMEEGTVELIPGEQVIRELRAKYAAPKPES